MTQTTDAAPQNRTRTIELLKMLGVLDAAFQLGEDGALDLSGKTIDFSAFVEIEDHRNPDENNDIVLTGDDNLTGATIIGSCGDDEIPRLVLNLDEWKNHDGLVFKGEFRDADFTRVRFTNKNASDITRLSDCFYTDVSFDRLDLHNVIAGILDGSIGLRFGSCKLPGNILKVIAGEFNRKVNEVECLIYCTFDKDGMLDVSGLHLIDIDLTGCHLDGNLEDTSFESCDLTSTTIDPGTPETPTNMMGTEFTDSDVCSLKLRCTDDQLCPGAWRHVKNPHDVHGLPLAFRVLMFNLGYWGPDKPT